MVSTVSHARSIGARSCWITVDLRANTGDLACLVRNGFLVHHSEDGDKLVMLNWFAEGPCTVPEYCSTFVGAGAVLLAPDSPRILLIRERSGMYRGWKLPGGHVDKGESIDGAAMRELLEETGQAGHPLFISGMRHQLNFNFGCADLYIVFCALAEADSRPGLVFESDEIAEAKWFDLGSDELSAALGDNLIARLAIDSALGALETGTAVSPVPLPTKRAGSNPVYWAVHGGHRVAWERKIKWLRDFDAGKCRLNPLGGEVVSGLD